MCNLKNALGHWFNDHSLVYDVKVRCTFPSIDQKCGM